MGSRGSIIQPTAVWKLNYHILSLEWEGIQKAKEIHQTWKPEKALSIRKKIRKSGRYWGTLGGERLCVLLLLSLL